MNTEKLKLSVCAIILIIAIVMIFCGIRSGSNDEVRGRGSMICLECIGLG